MDTAKRQLSGEIEPANKTPEKWNERRMILEYDLGNLSIVDENPMLYDSQTDIALNTALNNSFWNVLTNKRGSLLKGQPHYYYAGDEAEAKDEGNNEALVGKIGQKLCIVSDEIERVIATPLFDRLLRVTDSYIDVEFSNQRLRLSRGSFEPAETSETPRRYQLSTADSLPRFMSLERSIKISVLEATKDLAPITLPFSAETHPLEASHQLFESIETKVLDHITSGEPSKELAERLQNVDQALHMPSVDIQGQSYTITLRTSDEADIIFLHNSNIRTDQDRVADEMQKMSIPDFLELAYNNNLQHELLSSVLTERGFHFVRQHNGQFFIMGRDMHVNSMVTPEKPYYPTAFEQIQQQLNDYFQALHEQKPTATPLRAARIAAGIAIQREAELREQRKLSIPRRVMNWLGYFE